MTTFARILVPTDLTEFGASALRYGLFLREKLGSDLTAVNVIKPPYVVDPMIAAAEHDPALVEETRRQLREHVDAIRGDSALSMDLRVVTDYPAHGIVAVAGEIAADLVIMGTHGRSGWRHLLLGSVTETVLCEGRTPLLAVSKLDPAEKLELRSILCAVNEREAARDAASLAREISEATGAELTFMHVTDYDTEPAAEVAALLGDGAGANARIEEGSDAAARILEVADSAGVDLIVVGAQQKKFRHTNVVGTTSERIVRFAHRPVLAVVRPPE